MGGYLRVVQAAAGWASEYHLGTAALSFAAAAFLAVSPARRSRSTRSPRRSDGRRGAPAWSEPWVGLWLGAVIALAGMADGFGLWGHASRWRSMWGWSIAAIVVGTGWGFSARQASDLPARRSGPGDAAVWRDPLTVSLCLAVATSLVGLWWTQPDTELLLGLGAGFAGAFLGGFGSGRLDTAGVAVATRSLVAASPFVVGASAAGLPDAVAAGAVAVGVLPALAFGLPRWWRARRFAPLVVGAAHLVALSAVRHVRFADLDRIEAGSVVAASIVVNAVLLRRSRT